MSGRANYLPVSALILLDRACATVRDAFGHRPYLVGSCLDRADYRDVDVRTILFDDEYDEMFGTRAHLRSLICLTVSEHLSRASGLSVDFQVQRMTQANEQYSGRRHALGMDRLYPSDTGSPTAVAT
jgi:hypothetical protein